MQAYGDYTGYVDYMDMYEDDEWCTENEDGSERCTIPEGYTEYYSERDACKYNEEGELICLYPADYGADWCRTTEEGEFCTYPAWYK